MFLSKTLFFFSPFAGLPAVVPAAHEFLPRPSPHTPPALPLPLPARSALRRVPPPAALPALTLPLRRDHGRGWERPCRLLLLWMPMLVVDLGIGRIERNYRYNGEGSRLIL
ncbi:hypothetical protein SETIT_9G185800v2 [Setaria italica]|uniref:Uncharacterized protein n=2 Tax=Setaria TaxID=4554 RepID=A0A368SI41_SETIT|nr:hypothetical protein SETIT_9G185800v2 [Setaria italica]TKV92806.1 hypothetical protein SEVIR_9G184900v2 [Setaria viridis]